MILHNSFKRVSRGLSTAAAHHLNSVNKHEIEHFSRLSSLWWDEHGEFGLLHKMNPIRMQFIRQKLLETARDENGEDAVSESRVLADLDVLDVGCGGGLLSESLARLGARTTAIDASESNIAIASLHAAADPRLGSDALTYRHAPAESLLSEPKRFDVVCSMEVVEHVDNPAAFLESCASLVKPGGHLFLSTISRTPLAYGLTILMAEHILRKVTPGTHTFSKYINPSELVDFFSKTPSSRPWISRMYDGQPTRKEAEVRGMIYVPWRGEWVLAPRGAGGLATQCNYLFWVRKPMEE